MFIVETGVKGATRISYTAFESRDDAERRADRWRASNSIGSYYAHVHEYPEPLVWETPSAYMHRTNLNIPAGAWRVLVEATVEAKNESR